MGVTIHFEGHLRDQKALGLALGKVEALAQKLGWPVLHVDDAHTEMVRIVDEEDVPYVGPAKGVEVRPHPDCDPFRIVFGHDLFVQEFVKTQFAGAARHVRVTEVLREIEGYFVDLIVVDEGEFWDTLDHTILEAHIAATDEALANYMAEHPDARLKVRLPSGYIVDLMD
jgi:hypothetical protein